MNNGKHKSRSGRFAGGRFGGHHGGGGGRGIHHGGDGLRGGGLRMRAGRVLSSTELHLLILSLLADQPTHGYELIKAVQELTGGAYVPSPGVIYPALSYLEEAGQAESDLDGVKKRYRLSSTGRAALEEGRTTVKLLLERMRSLGQLASNGVVAPVGATSTDAAAGFEAARRELKMTLFDCLDATLEEQQRVADILQRAIAEIRKR